MKYTVVDIVRLLPTLLDSFVERVLWIIVGSP